MATFIILSATIGYMAESIFGFGGSVITYLILTQQMSPKEVVTMLPVFALVGSLFVLLSDYKSAKWGSHWKNISYKYANSCPWYIFS